MVSFQAWSFGDGYLGNQGEYKIDPKMTLIKGKKCPKCGRTDRIMEVEDKSKSLYNAGSGFQVFAKQYKCGNCGKIFKPDESAVNEAPAPEEAPVMEEEPVPEEAPVVEEEPVPEEAPVVEEEPVPEEPAPDEE
jgi:ssDNA-binding Zn-finger/Zn-ribbon topoisomerase 1